MERTIERTHLTGSVPPLAVTAPILVASDGAPASAAAFEVARLLAERSGASVRVVSVLEPTSALVPPLEPPGPPLRPGASRVDERRARLGALMGHAAGAAPSWPVEIASGDRVPTIARIATEQRAQLIVTGRTQHGAVERIAHGETPLAIARATGVPVLAVPASMSRLPRTVVVAVDLGDAGAAAGSVARALFGDAVAVHLVHVSAPPLPRHERALREEEAADDTAIRRAFERAMTAWQLPADVATASHVLMGSLDRELLTFAYATDADLVVAGMTLQPGTPHLPRRSLIQRLYRKSPRALLIVPVGETRIRRPRDADTELVVEEARWPDLLAHVGRRNARRRTSLAVVDRIGGAHVLARGRPITSLAYDRHARRVTVTLGESTRPNGQLTHHVTRPLAIAVHRHPSGFDDALLIRYAHGQTLLTFE
jgi:nucleotide-binding universal stress UspA family protein